ncbi:MAG: hypothetical protein O6913_09890, partial [Chloroflexi bacterium]|nr:hypothetical protein [Chloroflexota bacterium]
MPGPLDSGIRQVDPTERVADIVLGRVGGEPDLDLGELVREGRAGLLEGTEGRFEGVLLVGDDLRVGRVVRHRSGDRERLVAGTSDLGVEARVRERGVDVLLRGRSQEADLQLLAAIEVDPGIELPNGEVDQAGDQKTQRDDREVTA